MTAAAAVVLSLLVAGPSTLILGPPVIAIVAAFIGTVGAIVAFPRRLARAFGAYSWLGRTEVDRFQARTGGRVPIRPADREAWLERSPPTGPFVLPRTEMLAFVGRYAEARQEMEAADAAGAESAVERASLGQYIGWLETGSLDLTGLERAVAALPEGSEDRRMGETSMALAQSRDRFMTGDRDWYAPLEAARSALGSAPRSVVLRDTWRPIGVGYVLAAFAVSLLVSLSRLLV